MDYKTLCDKIDQMHPVEEVLKGGIVRSPRSSDVGDLKPQLDS